MVSCYTIKKGKSPVRTKFVFYKIVPLLYKIGLPELHYQHLGNSNCSVTSGMIHTGEGFIES
jgi:hypothetical protein